jgi:uncharacterized membrane protein
VQTSRLEAFSDAVFAAAITLLVLGLHVPGAGDGDLGHALVDEWPSFASYLVSFVVIGIYLIAGRGGGMPSPRRAAEES